MEQTTADSEPAVFCMLVCLVCYRLNQKNYTIPIVMLIVIGKQCDNGFKTIFYMFHTLYTVSVLTNLKKLKATLKPWDL